MSILNYLKEDRRAALTNGGLIVLLRQANNLEHNAQEKLVRAINKTTENQIPGFFVNRIIREVTR